MTASSGTAGDAAGARPTRCRCCHGTLSHVFAVASWRARDWDGFRYGECATCGSLSLLDDMAADQAPETLLAGAETPAGASTVTFDRTLTGLDEPVAEWSAVGRGARLSFTTPVAQGPVWEEFRDNWVALDAPMHRVVPTRHGLELLAARSGMRIVEIRPCSRSEHVVLSELVSRRIRPWVPPSTVLGRRELAHLEAAGARLRAVSDCPELAIVLERGPS